MGVYENPMITFLRRNFQLDSFKFVTVYNVIYVYSTLLNPCLGRISRKYTFSQRSRSSHFTSVILKILEGILKIRKKAHHPRYLHCKKLQVEFLYLKHIHNKTHTNFFFFLNTKRAKMLKSFPKKHNRYTPQQINFKIKWERNNLSSLSRILLHYLGILTGCQNVWLHIVK